VAISDTYLDELISKSDIVDVVGSYVNLNKRSGSNQFGLCPFHSERTPSFSVNQEKQIFHCFGCGKGGGVINFIMEVEGLSFQDAVQFLAKRAGMQLPDDGTPDEVRNKRARILSLNKDAAKYYYSILSSPEGRNAVSYMQTRKIDHQTAVRFGLGAAPDGWDYLLRAMKAKGYSEQELFEAGLIKRGKNNGFYDTFRNRLMFPVIDVRGSVLGFSGRILGDGEPKYLNSPDTPVFNKSKNLFGINLAKKNKDGPFILCEGNVDVVSLHQAGFSGAVASLGTSLTPDQARLLSRYTDKIILAYDGDAAGIKAAKRAIGIFEQTGIQVRVLRITGAKDPDEYIKTYGAAAFANLLEGSPNQLEYQLSQIRMKYNLDDDAARVEYLKEATEFLSRIVNAVEREVYTGRVSRETGISADAIMTEIKKLSKRRTQQERKKNEQEMLRPSQNRQPDEREIKYDDIISATAEEGVIQLLILDPSLLSLANELTITDFSSPFLYKVFSIIVRRIQQNSELSLALVCNELEPAEAARITEVLQRPQKISEGAATMKDYISKMNTQRIKREARQNLDAVTRMFREKKGYGTGHE